MQADWLTMHILRHPPFFDTTRAGPVLAANKIVHGIALIVTLLCLILVAVVIAVKLSSLKWLIFTGQAESLLCAASLIHV
jgi:hypothetical protein